MLSHDDQVAVDDHFETAAETDAVNSRNDRFACSTRGQLHCLKIRSRLPTRVSSRHGSEAMAVPEHPFRLRLR